MAQESPKRTRIPRGTQEAIVQLQMGGNLTETFPICERWDPRWPQKEKVLNASKLAPRLFQEASKRLVERKIRERLYA